MYTICSDITFLGKLHNKENDIMPKGLSSNDIIEIEKGNIKLPFCKILKYLYMIGYEIRLVPREDINTKSDIIINKLLLNDFELVNGTNQDTPKFKKNNTIVTLINTQELLYLNNKDNCIESYSYDNIINNNIIDKLGCE